ncbi:putative conjugative transfer protein TraC [Legionella quinlivanii]|uniref:Putative conjugative transfer protein TraC n=1 Tax=Legionella quinlivanii TaxID=45073 RepID=A0A0W0XSE0_9GAMM|nr:MULTISPECIES: type IV secretion system protein TraC [Legionella]KTD47444.1 putative conjugative transfer protein TraC [Legionella quinlivanii]MCE3043687.1 type IV secretion system protein TraC [Legionella sp. 16cNR16C]SEG46440.1 conjugal transfer ATP-binding protein TraC [Legionella quinlivanii DSM 21216]STY49835.1 putative conjugative transfer protein TraC [Legionella quinlivanii]
MLGALKQYFQDFKDSVNDYLVAGEESISRQNTLHASDHRYPLFCEELPYQYYDEDSHLFINRWNTGLLYRITPLTGANEKIAEQLDSILRTKVSDEYCLQLILVKHNQVGHELDAFLNQFISRDFKNLNLLGRSLRSFYGEAAVHGFKSNTNVNPRLTQTECYIVIDKMNGKQEEETKAQFAQFRVAFEAALMSAKIGFRACHAVDLLRLLHFYLANEPDTLYPKSSAYDPSRFIKYQAVGHDFDVEITKEGLLISGVNHQGKAFETVASVMTIDELPRQYHLWDNINNTNNVFHPEQSIPCNHIISVTYLIEEQTKAQGRANRKTGDLDKKAKGDYALHVAGTEKKAREWRHFRDDLAAGKTRSCRMLYNLVLFSRPSEQARDLEAARVCFSYNGIKLALSRRMQPPYFLASMPFLFTNHLQKGFQLPTMMWPISSWNATQYMPVLSDWAGTGKGMLLPTLRNQFACIDPFSGKLGTNYNIAITGTSGGGKSFFIQMLMLNILFNGGDLFIVDVGGSYKKLCHALGGVYLEYANLSMNPFTHVTNIGKEIKHILSLFQLLACSKDGASDDDRGTLREAILQAFFEHGQATTIDTVQSQLLELYQRDREKFPTGKILAKNLDPFCTYSEHGTVFNAPSKLSPEARIIVVDLKEIEDDETIRAPVLLSILSQFQNRMFNSDRSRQKMCVIDEAWSLFSGDQVAVNFINRGFRTGRRHNASFVTITQGIDDYYSFPEARAAWENSSLKLVFLQDADSLTKHQNAHNTFSDYELTLLRSFPKAKDAGFSQVLVRADGISSFHRLFVDPFTRVLLSSDGHDYQKVMNYVAEGFSYVEASLMVASEHYGLSRDLLVGEGLVDAV